MKNFKKIGTAVAVTSALGVAGTAHSLTLGEPGEALLVPYVLCSQTDGINTLVGITVPGSLGDDPTQIGVVLPNGALTDTNSGFATTPNSKSTLASTGQGGTLSSSTGDDIHWFFFNTTSVHQLDNGVPASKNDFVPFDWCTAIATSGKTSLYDTTGYLVFSNEDARDNDSAGFAMFGDAAVVEGNWQSAAFIPVVPMADGSLTAVAACSDEVVYAGGIPSDVNPLCAGIALDNADGSTAADNAAFNMRYFLDPALNGGTDLVVWTDRNCRSTTTDGCNRTGVSIEVYDTEETSGSDVLDLSLELNVRDAAALAWTKHVDDGTWGEGLVDTGSVEIVLSEVADSTATAGPDTSAVAFSLIRFGTASNARQVQTALAQERGIWNGANPFTD